MFTIALVFSALLTTATPDRYEVRLARGESAVVLVHQLGRDVVVELRSPGGELLDVIDGPTGRSGDERVEIIAADAGAYQLHIRPYDAGETSGSYSVELVERRTAARTRALLRSRQKARQAATEWLRPRSATLSSYPLAPFDELAARTRVIGLGEATHGSREFGDARLSLTKRLIERHGVRLVALEASSTQLDAMAPYAAGASAATVEDRCWIGRRARRELIEFLRSWNLAHPDDRVRLIGVDAQDNQSARTTVGAFVQRAYGDEFAARWLDASNELTAADAQSAVFGDSSVKPAVRDFLFELRAMLESDAPLLRARFGGELDAALRAAATLAEFADYNSGGHRSRDWYMAAGVLRRLGAGKAVFWAHNAHVAARGKTAGAMLRSALGCDYAPVAMTFGAGSFVAQLPNDRDGRLVISSLPQASVESVESVLAPLADEPVISTWPCGVDRQSAPEWFGTAQPIHWVGALWEPASLPSAAFQPYDLLHDFDGVVYFPVVAAEELPPPHPPVPARAR